VVNRLGPAGALRTWGAATPTDRDTVVSFIGEHLDTLSGTEKKTVIEYRRYLVRDIDPVLSHIPLSTLPVPTSRIRSGSSISQRQSEMDCLGFRL
jgi:hypothetical protein